jgi:Transposase DDE domain
VREHRRSILGVVGEFDLGAIERAVRALLGTERGRQAYARRKATVEPVFDQIRAARRFGQFSFRGLA